MRIIRFLDAAGQERYAQVDDPRVGPVLLEGDPYMGFDDTGIRVPAKTLLAPVEPRVIICIGLNYRKHAEETGAEIPTRPVVFMKNPAAVQHPGCPIVLPRSCRDPLQVDFECELAVVIGKAAKNVSRDDALSHVLGYTVANDVSARKWQKEWGGGQWIRGKSFDTFCPLGPLMVTADELTIPQSLRITTKLNGRVMQDSNTGDMIFSVADLIAQLSEDMTLLPGTVLLTGTPSGVGAARKPPVFMKPGDTVEVTIDGIGSLINSVV